MSSSLEISLMEAVFTYKHVVKVNMNPLKNN